MVEGGRCQVSGIRFRLGTNQRGGECKLSETALRLKKQAAQRGVRWADAGRGFGYILGFFWAATLLPRLCF